MILGSSRIFGFRRIGPGGGRGGIDGLIGVARPDDTPAPAVVAQEVRARLAHPLDPVYPCQEAGVLTWVNRLKRVRERCSDLHGDNGWRWRVLRTSNSYAFTDPGAGADRPRSKSEKETGTGNQDSFLLDLRRGEAANGAIREAAIRFGGALSPA